MNMKVIPNTLMSLQPCKTETLRVSVAGPFRPSANGYKFIGIAVDSDEKTGEIYCNTLHSGSQQSPHFIVF